MISFNLRLFYLIDFFITFFGNSQFINLLIWNMIIYDIFVQYLGLTLKSPRLQNNHNNWLNIVKLAYLKMLISKFLFCEKEKEKSFWDKQSTHANTKAPENNQTRKRPNLRMKNAHIIWYAKFHITQILMSLSNIKYEIV